MAEEMERHFGAQQIGKGRVGGIGVTAAGNALVAQVIEGIPCQQVFVIPQAQTSGCRGIDAQNQLADFGIGFLLTREKTCSRSSMKKIKPRPC